MGHPLRALLLCRSGTVCRRRCAGVPARGLVSRHEPLSFRTGKKSPMRTSRPIVPLPWRGCRNRFLGRINADLELQQHSWIKEKARAGQGACFSLLNREGNAKVNVLQERDAVLYARKFVARKAFCVNTRLRTGVMYPIKGYMSEARRFLGCSGVAGFGSSMGAGTGSDSAGIWTGAGLEGDAERSSVEATAIRVVRG